MSVEQRRYSYNDSQRKNKVLGVIMRVKRQNIIGIMGVKQRTHSYNESQTENIVGIMGVNQRTYSYNES